MKDSSAIYDSIIHGCEPFAWPGRWSFFTESADVVGPVSDPQGLLLHLLDEFKQEALVDAGVVSLDSDQNCTLANSLDGDLFVPLRQRLSDACTEIVTSAGCLSGRSLPLFAAMVDEHTRANLDGAGQRLFVANDLLDVALLRALNLPAGAATGLETLDLPQLFRLCRRGGLAGMPETRTSVSGKSEDPLLQLAGQLREMQAESFSPGFRLTLVAWSPSTCSRAVPPAIGEAIDYLSTALRHLRIAPSRIEVWRPAEDTIERLEFLLSFCDEMIIRQVLLESTQESTSSLPGYLETEQSVPPTASDYRRKLTQLLEQLSTARSEGADGQRRIRSAHDALMKSVDCQIVGPLIDEGIGSENLGSRALKLQMADLVRMFHSHSAYAHMLSSKIVQDPSEGCEQSLQRQTRNILSIVKAVTQLKKQIDQTGG